MKIINKIYVFTTVATALLLTSCLSDSDYDNNLLGTKNTQNQNFVEVHLTSSDNTNDVSRSYDNMDRDTTINIIPINLTSGAATSDVVITFEVLDTINSATDPNAAIMKSYVEDDGYVIPDFTKYQILNTGNKVTIPAGSKTGYIKVKFKPSDFLGETFVFGIKITAVSDAKYTISNLSTGFVKFGIKNMYDGEYMITGSMVDAANAALVGAYPHTALLITQDATSVAMWDNVYGDYYYHLIKNGTSYSVYGSFSPKFKLDANNNVVSVVNLYGQPASNGRSAELDPSGINKYDPATKTLRVKYWMNQPGSTHRTSFDETMEYIGPR